MKYTIFFLVMSTFLFSCEDKKNETNQATEENSIKLDQQNQTVLERNIPKNSMAETTEPAANFEVKNNIYTEYYPGTRRIKFQGPQTDDGKRDGKWMYFDEKGTELSMTTYKKGLRHGPTMVKYPNGNIHYTGEYTDGKTTGIWTTYSEIGEKLTVKNFDELK